MYQFRNGSATCYIISTVLGARLFGQRKPNRQNLAMASDVLTLAASSTAALLLPLLPVVCTLKSQQLQHKS
jgi:hypothetical protein